MNPKGEATTPETKEEFEERLRYYMHRELYKWDRVELDTALGKKDFMAIEFILDILPQALADRLYQSDIKERS